MVTQHRRRVRQIIIGLLALRGLTACNGSPTAPSGGGTTPPPPPPPQPAVSFSGTSLDPILRGTINFSVAASGGTAPYSISVAGKGTTVCIINSASVDCAINTATFPNGVDTLVATVTDAKQQKATAVKAVLVGNGALSTMPVDTSRDKLMCGPSNWVATPTTNLGMDTASVWSGLQYCLPQGGQPARTGISYASMLAHPLPKSDMLKYGGVYTVTGSGFLADSNSTTAIFIRLENGSGLQTLAIADWKKVTGNFSDFLTISTLGNDLTTATATRRPMFYMKTVCASAVSTATLKNSSMTFVHNGGTNDVVMLIDHTITEYPCS